MTGGRREWGKARQRGTGGPQEQDSCSLRFMGHQAGWLLVLLTLTPSLPLSGSQSPHLENEWIYAHSHPHRREGQPRWGQVSSPQALELDPAAALALPFSHCIAQVPSSLTFCDLVTTQKVSSSHTELSNRSGRKIMEAANKNQCFKTKPVERSITGGFFD